MCRVRLPQQCKAIFERERWSVPPIVQELVRRGNLGIEERYRVFNMGIGYTLIVPSTDASAAIAAVPQATVVGAIEARAPGEPKRRHPARAQHAMTEFIRELAQTVDSESPRDQRARAAAEIVRSARGYRWVGIYDVGDDEIVLIAEHGSTAVEEAMRTQATVSDGQRDRSDFGSGERHRYRHA